MKKLKFTSILVLAIILLFSCSNDNNEDTSITGDYFPSTVNNYWNYNVVQKTTNPSSTINSQDFLTVNSVSNSSFELKVNSGNAANGVMNTILTSGTPSKTASALTLTGYLKVPIDGINDIHLNFNNAVLYDINADKNAVLSTFNGTFTQDFQGFPLTIKYELSFNKIQNQNSLKVNSKTYTNITGTAISLNLSISTTINVQGNNITLPVLDAQDVLVVKSYYGENVGLLQSESTLKVEFNATTLSTLKTLGINAEIPASQLTTNTQNLTTFFVAE